MAELREVQLQISGCPNQGAQFPSHPPLDAPTSIKKQLHSMLHHWKWWLLVALNITFLLVGQTAGTLLGRFYFNEGGKSKWMATLLQPAGAPILILPILLFPSTEAPRSTVDCDRDPPIAKIAAIYVGLGLAVAVDMLMHTYGLLYLPVSTYSVLCSTQLAFNVVFSYVLNDQKLTHLIFNSVVLLTFSASLLGFHSGPTGVSAGNYTLGFVLTVAGSAVFSLVLSLMQLTFQKVLKRVDFSVVLWMQMWTSLVASAAAVVGLFASGEWRGLRREMEGFEKGRTSYVATLVGTAISWQVTSVGMVGLTFVVSSLFSNVMSTLALPIVPIFTTIFFKDKMDGVRIVTILMAIWGFFSYIYQQYQDDVKAKESRGKMMDVS